MNRKMLMNTVCCALAGLVLGCSGNHGKADDNLSLGRNAFTEIYGSGKVELVDELYAEDFVDDSPGGGHGRGLIRQAVTEFHRAFPDLRIDIEDAFASGDRVVLRYTARGRHTGPYYDIPASGKPVAIRGITIFQITNGKIKTEWTEYDRLGAMRQIGAIPAN
jgi:steroid delta-isomerase-like uncharacterized protein